MKSLIACLIATCIISSLSIPSFSVGQSVNMLNNPGFDEGIKGWNTYGTGVKQVVNLEGNNVLLVNNTDGSNIGVIQTITLPEPKRTAFEIKCKIKPIKVTEKSLVSLDLYVFYQDDTYDVIVSPFRAYPQDVGSWIEKKYIIDPTKPVKSFRVYFLNYYDPSEAYYDDAYVGELEEIQDIVLNDGTVDMTLTRYGNVKSIVYQGQEQLKNFDQFSRIYFDNGSYTQSNRIEPLGGDSYKVGYLNFNTEIIFKILPKDGYFIFGIESYNNISSDTDYIEMIRIKPLSSGQSAQWLKDAPGSTLFFNLIPMDVNSYCSRGNSYYCRLSKRIGFEKTSWILITTKKENFFDSIERVVFENSLPKAILSDGKWLWNSAHLRDSYLFASMTGSNYKNLLEYAKRGNFRQVMFIEPIIYGYYNKSKPIYFQNTEDFISAADEFLKAGISTGIHTFAGRIDPSDNILDFSNPSIPLKDALISIPIGKLEAGISSTATEITINASLSDNVDFNAYFSDVSYVGYGKNFLVGNEIFSCQRYVENRLLECRRGLYDTLASSHSSGDEIGFLPFRQMFFINPENQLFNESVKSFYVLLDRIKSTLVYFDGDISFIPNGMKDGEKIAYQAKHGFYSYIQDRETIPLFQLAWGSVPQSAYINSRVATWDGVTFKNKQFTKEYKVNRILEDDIYYDGIMSEMGWWKFHGALFNNGYEGWDIDSTTFDETHYVMTKVLVFNVPIGLQLGHLYTRHERLGDLFDLVGLYHTLIHKDREEGIIPERVKNYLKDPDKEAEINNVSGYNLVEKKFTQNYCNYDISSGCTFNVDNPFGTQRLRMEIRPRFDYYPFDDSIHTTVYNFSTATNPKPSSLPTKTNNNDVSCSLNDEGTVTVINNGSIIGGCEISLPNTLNICFQRGFGISMEGDSKGELIVIRLDHTGSSSLRDYKFLVDFSGKRDIMLGNPTGDFRDYVNGVVVDWMDRTYIQRHWEYNFCYYKDNKITIYINNVKPGSTSTLRLYSVKALAEKGNSTLVNPVVKVNGKEILFNLNLTVDDANPNILEYDGFTKTYNLYNSNQKLLSSGTLSKDEILLNNGLNVIEFSSDLSNPMHSSRADIRVSVYDDEDGDLIPTNGDYSTDKTPCNGKNNFCDDNCPKTFNPDQKDSDNDGIGDACEKPICGNNICEERENSISCPHDCHVAYSNSQDVFWQSKEEIRLFSNNNKGFRITVLPTKGKLYEGNTKILSVPYLLSEGRIYYISNTASRGLDMFSFAVEDSEPANIYITIVEPNAEWYRTKIPAINDSRWLHSASSYTKKDISKEDYLKYIKKIYYRLQKNYRDNSGNIENPYNSENAFYEAFFYKLTGEKEYFDYSLKMLNSSYYCYNIGLCKEEYGFEKLLYPLKTYLLIKDSQLMKESDKAWIKEYLLLLETHLGNLEYGSFNRAMAAAVSRRALVMLYPDDLNNKERMNYSMEVWNDFKKHYDTWENSDNYNGAFLSYVDMWGYVTGEDIYKDARMKAFVERFLIQFSPDGIMPYYGDTIGWGNDGSVWFYLLEKWAKVYNNGNYKWIAHMMFNWIMENEQELKQYGNPEIWLMRNFMEAYNICDDSVSEKKPTISSKLTYRNEMYHNPSSQPWRGVFNEEIIPNKISMRSGWDIEDMFALVEVSDNYMGHGHCDTGSINFLSFNGSTLLADTPYIVKDHRFHNTFQIITSLGSRCDINKITQISTTKVPIFEDNSLSSYSKISVINYTGEKADLDRHIFFLKNRFVWVKDVITSRDTLNADIGPAWNTISIYGTQGNNWVNTALNTIPSVYIWDLKYLMQWKNKPWDLLIIFPEIKGTLQIDSVNIDNTRFITNQEFQNSMKYKIWDKKSVSMKSNEKKFFNSILVPHYPFPDNSYLAERFEIILDESSKSVIKFSGVNEEVFIGINDMMEKVNAGKIVTDAQAFVIEIRNSRYSYWVLNATHLSIDGNEIFRYSEKKNIESQICGNIICEYLESSSNCPQDCASEGDKSQGSENAGEGIIGTPESTGPGSGGVSTGSCSTGQTNPCGSSIGECKQGTQSCVNGQWTECIGAIDPTEEICDGLDNNCNGQIDENCLCVEGQNKPCGSNIGICKQGVQSCVDGQWGACIGNTPPLTEDICFNYLDDNCNGEVDEGCGEAFNTCNNGKLDEGEQGTDCGGKCPKKCPDLEMISVLMVLVGLFGMIGTTVYFGYVK